MIFENVPVGDHRGNGHRGLLLPQPGTQEPCRRSAAKGTASDTPLLGRRGGGASTSTGGRRSTVPRIGASHPFADKETNRCSAHRVSISLCCRRVRTCSGSI